MDKTNVAPIGGRRFPGMKPDAVAAIAVREAVAAALEAGTPRSRILHEVANGLTGQLSGRLETSAGKAMLAAFNHAADEFGDGR